MSLKYLFDLFNDKFETYKDELQYLAIEHLCVGHTYRLLNYPEATKQDFKDIIIFMEKYFGKHWDKNKYAQTWSSKSKYGLFCSYLYRQPLAEELEMTEFVRYCRHRAIRSAVGGIGLNLAKPELQDKQVEHMLDYLKTGGTII